MLRVEGAYPNGVPQTAVQGFDPQGLAWHWTAGGTGRAGWDATVRHLVDTRYTVNASYHGGFWHEHDTETTVVQWIVPLTKAAHSIAPSQVFRLNPNKPAALQEARFAEVRRILARDSDPNADCTAVAYAGMPADLERDLACPIFRADVVLLARTIDRYLAERPHFGHGWIQPINRYEMDVATDFVALLYVEDDVSLANMSPLFGSVAVLNVGATARRTPEFDRNDYDAGKLFTLGSASSGPALGWVQGSNLTLVDGTVYDPRTRWLATWNRDHGVVFWHERDVASIKPPAETDAAAKLKVAEDTIAALKTKIAAAVAALR